MMASNDTEGLRESFNHALQRSIREGLAKVVGQETAKSVEFYLDSSIAVKNIIQYTKSLEKFFTASSKLLEDKIAETLYSNLGLEFRKNDNFKLNDYVTEAKKLRIMN